MHDQIREGLLLPNGDNCDFCALQAISQIKFAYLAGNETADNRLITYTASDIHQFSPKLRIYMFCQTSGYIGWSLSFKLL